VIIGVLAVGLFLPADQVVTGIAAANSLGMLVGAAVGWVMITTSRTERIGFGLLRPCLRDLPLGLAAGALVAWPAVRFVTAGPVAALVGCFVAAAACMIIFTAALWLFDRRSLSALQQLWRARSAGAPATGADDDLVPGDR